MNWLGQTFPGLVEVRLMQLKATGSRRAVERSLSSVTAPSSWNVTVEFSYNREVPFSRSNCTFHRYICLAGCFQPLSTAPSWIAPLLPLMMRSDRSEVKSTSRQISVATRSVLHCMFSQMELVSWVLKWLTKKAIAEFEHVLTS